MRVEILDSTRLAMAIRRRWEPDQYRVAAIRALRGAPSHIGMILQHSAYERALAALTSCDMATAAVQLYAYLRLHADTDRSDTCDGMKRARRLISRAHCIGEC